MGTMERKEDQKHKGRAYNNRAGHIKAIRLAALILLIPFQFGCHLFVRTCPPGEGAFVKPIEPADSIALDIVDSNDRSNRGCGWNSYCASSLFENENRRSFVEVLVHKPDPDHLSKEKGWYRYWVAPAGDPACALFYASEKAQKDWHNRFSHPDIPPAYRVNYKAICLASKKIKEPESRYLYRSSGSFDSDKMGMLSLRSDLIDRHTGETRVHRQRTSYRKFPDEFPDGGYIPYHLARLVLVAGASKLTEFFLGKSLDKGSCRLPRERYKIPMGSFGPKSSLGPLSDEWPALPEPPSPPLPTDSAK